MQSENDTVKNCISIDVEGFIESNMQSFPVHRKYISETREKYEIEKNINFILDLLDELNVKATFFFLGRIGRDIPGTVKEVAGLGHEIGCHSFEHVRVFGLTQDQFRKSLMHAKKLLEDLSGRKVCGFRAPDFSITESNIWALDILRETGFIYDSSIFPTGLHDVYGIKSANTVIHRLPNGLIEFPLSVIKFLGRAIPFGGGGYFRLYPAFVTKFCIRKLNEVRQPIMVYLHPYEIGPIVPYVTELSSYRKFRHYYNCSGCFDKLKKMHRVFRFDTAMSVLKQSGFL